MPVAQVGLVPAPPETTALPAAVGTHSHPGVLAVAAASASVPVKPGPENEDTQADQTRGR